MLPVQRLYRYLDSNSPYITPTTPVSNYKCILNLNQWRRSPKDQESFSPGAVVWGTSTPAESSRGVATVCILVYIPPKISLPYKFLLTVCSHVGH